VRRSLAIAAVLALGAGGCAKDTIYIAEISDAGVDAAPIVCTVSDAGSGTGCPDGSFCEFSEATKCKPTEGTEGTCAPIRAASCASDVSYGAQCGCDGVTYFNECLRREYRMSAQSAAPCDLLGVVPPKLCNSARPDDPDCPSCAVIISSPVSIAAGDAGASFLSTACTFASTGGTCWVTPACTSSPPGGARLLSCSGKCKDACVAIRTGGPMIPCLPEDAGPN
jgi:hypothetical protein